MRKLKVFAIIFCMAFLLVGCQGKAQKNQTGSNTVFSSSLPDGYSISDVDDNSCTVYRGTDAIGGIALTNLNDGKIANIDKTELRQYLDHYAAPPLRYEYVAMYYSDDGYDYIAINLKITDSTTEEYHTDHHYLFEKDGNCFDLWLSDERIEVDAQKVLLAAVAGSSGGTEP